MMEFKRILVPLDGSPLAERALPFAMALAQKFGSQIILLRALDIPVATVPPVYPEVSLAWVGEAREHAHREAESYLEARLDELRQQGVEAKTLSRDGSPAEEVINTATAEDVDLIVMSTHGRGGLARWTFGSVADKVARHGPCPVLLVRQKPEAAHEA